VTVHAVLHRADDGDAAGGLAKHVLGFLADGLDGLLGARAAFDANGDDRGFVKDDAAAAHIDERVGRAEVDGEIVGEILGEETEHL